MYVHRMADAYWTEYWCVIPSILTLYSSRPGYVDCLPGMSGAPRSEGHAVSDSPCDLAMRLILVGLTRLDLQGKSNYKEGTYMLN